MPLTVVLVDRYIGFTIIFPPFYCVVIDFLSSRPTAVYSDLRNDTVNRLWTEKTSVLLSSKHK